MLSTLFIFLPLIVGYAIHIEQPIWLTRVNRITSHLVSVILFLMGLSIASMDNFNAHLSQVLKLTLTFFGCISLANLLALPWLDRKFRLTLHKSHQSSPSLWAMARSSLSLVLVVALGIIVGLFFDAPPVILDNASELILQLLLFFIGLQLRSSGLTLKQIVLNKKGLAIALVVVVTSLCGGVIAALILDIPLTHGLAMASGFGWYSLSGILITDSLGAVLGNASLLLELLRELAAIILIPLFIQHRPLTTIGYSGATAMDFTLPIIQTHGGVQCVPIAIVSGFILSLLVPVLILFFTQL